jgi:hypothetical protein
MFRVERLTAAHDVTRFSCGNPLLDRWLHSAAVNADRSGAARVRVWLGREGEIAGYFAITPHTVDRTALPANIGRGAPSLVPGFLLARLAVADHLQGHGHCAELLYRAYAVILDLIRAGGGRLVIVDAIDERARSFHQHLGFRSAPDNADRLAIKVSSVAHTLKQAWP